MTTIAVFVLAVVATARLARLIALDKVAEPVRAVLVRRLGTDSMIVYLVHCYWCLSMWIAAPITAAVYAATDPHTVLGAPDWLTAPLYWLTVAHLGAMLARGER